MKFCRDCKHFGVNNECKVIELGSPDMVHGTIYRIHAGEARSNKNFCGKNAVYFEASWWHKLMRKIFK